MNPLRRLFKALNPTTHHGIVAALLCARCRCIVHDANPFFFFFFAFLFFFSFLSGEVIDGSVVLVVMLARWWFALRFGAAVVFACGSDVGEVVIFGVLVVVQ
ncbi:Hypothetical predicted protein [Olea europaea subsp. europaea]|uniref:Uncharacterized protein n=1 Tax=Olea europaea subsp. europaea TaxID=158383 RepID=A0A8S0QGB4_OLEEU|nr:Hypothetical predicted protein [Olea europaea subsp. europaea]